MAEDAARELANLPLEDALQLVHLHAERGSPKAEPAARRWLVRYLTEGTPSLRDVARVTARLAEASSWLTRRWDEVTQSPQPQDCLHPFTVNWAPVAAEIVAEDRLCPRSVSFD
jgi:hypothetical protein